MRQQGVSPKKGFDSLYFNSCWQGKYNTKSFIYTFVNKKNFFFNNKTKNYELD